MKIDWTETDVTRNKSNGFLVTTLVSKVAIYRGYNQYFLV